MEFNITSQTTSDLKTPFHATRTCVQKIDLRLLQNPLLIVIPAYPPDI